MRILVVASAVMLLLVAAPVAYPNTGGTACDGVLAGPVVEGDVVVPAGATCTANAVRILGDVVVDEDARFFGDAQIEGGVTIASGGAFHVSDSAVAGDIVCNGCAGLGLTFMWDPTFEITSSGKVKVVGAVDAFIAIEGWVVRRLDVRNSTGDFFFSFSASGDVVFADNVGNAGFWFSDVGGNLTIVGNTGGGDGFPADFTLVTNVVGKNLVFSDNVGPSYFETNAVGKDLVCLGNDPQPTGWGNAAGRSVKGQCTEVTGPAPE